jgi:GNAT superfamily N-acetyltransferase
MARAAARMSLATLSSRFFTGTSDLPPSYLPHAVAGAPRRWGAVLAFDGDDVIGWADFGRPTPWSPEADVGVLVADAWQRRGIGAQLIDALIPHVGHLGIERLRAEVQAANTAALALMSSAFGPSASAAREGDVCVFAVDLARLLPARPMPVGRRLALLRMPYRLPAA